MFQIQNDSNLVRYIYYASEKILCLRNLLWFHVHSIKIKFQ